VRKNYLKVFRGFMSLLVEKLLYYGVKHLGLSGYDITYSRNLLLTALGLSEPFGSDLSEPEKKAIDKLQVPDILIKEIKDFALGKNLAEIGFEDSFAAGLMAVITHSPENVRKKFSNIKKARGIQAACDYLYALSIKNYYIQKTAIDRNLFWRADFSENYLEITVNLSKPEKDNKDIARQSKIVSTAYPKCVLCKENIGFEGTDFKAPRQNLRFVPVKLSGEKWFVQYSPFLYYNEHCIVISEEHRPMKVDKSTFVKLADFVDAFPNYFVGSNASLPIVGGSILSHEHYQGGGHKMPLHNARDYKLFSFKNLDGVKISIIDWYNSAVRLASKNKKQLFDAAGIIFDKWDSYNDEEAGVISKTSEQHNCITPIMRKDGGEYILELILRNNRVNAEHPEGIFHAHKEFHNIKKEGIGLIEAMGLFILPGRLLRQTEQIADILCGNGEYDESLCVHGDMIENLKMQKSSYTSVEAKESVKNYINRACMEILINTAVFKPDEKGRKQFGKFIKFCIE